MFQPAIKWSGSKRSQASKIVSYFPNDIKTYYEPFCGGCSIFMALALSQKGVKKYVLSDINEDLIKLWIYIKKDYGKVVSHYTELWNELNKNDDIERKKNYFYFIRNRFNNEKSPLDFMFISRTTTNGLIRYNKSGEFNNSFHITRTGIKPGSLRKILKLWNYVLNKNNVQLICCEYGDINSNKGDFLYLDPPYANTKGMYYGAIQLEQLWNWIRNQPCGYALSFDGISGKDNNTFNVPRDLYSEHIFIDSGNSSFKRLFGNNKKAQVHESLYNK